MSLPVDDFRSDVPGPEVLLHLRRLLQQSDRIVAFTGAGISTESGIPDYRSPGGVWTKTEPILFEDFLSDLEARREAWRRKSVDRSMEVAVPNDGHRCLHELYQRGQLRSVITQNIDGLHQASGIPPERVIELHGNATYALCLSCRKEFELKPIIEAFLDTHEPPVCDDCQGIVKTATISFGQQMPAEPMRRADLETQDCDLFLAIGSSLVVYPAAGFPILAKERGARLVILNREATDLDAIADLVVHAEIGPTLKAALAAD